MALVNMNFESEYLGNNVDLSIILPDKTRGLTPEEFYGSGKKYRVLWLLHGTFGDHTDWVRKSNIELYACENDLIVVMPSALNSNYENWPEFGTGYGMWDFMTKELMPLVYNWYPASSRREDNYIAGLSMGGAGALKFALAYPEKFAGAAVLSAAPRNVLEKDRLTVEAFRRGEKPDPKDGMPAFGDTTRVNPRFYRDLARYGAVEAYLASASNTWDRIAEFAGSDQLPKLFFSCGTEDFGYRWFVEFKAYVEKLGIPAVFNEGPGRHEWRVWDRDIQLALEYFGISGRNGGNEF